MAGRRKIIITRHEQDAGEVASAVTDAGFEPLFQPLNDIVYQGAEMPRLDADNTLIFTSANGVTGFTRHSSERGHPVYAVGDNTAETARNAGFKKVVSAGGGVDDLLALLEKSDEKRFFYARGQEISADIGPHILKNGKIFKEFIVYDARLVEFLEVSLLKSLDNGEINAIMLFSRRSSAHFADLIEQYDRLHCLKSVKALCISAGLLDSLNRLPFQERIVADTPDRYGMIGLLKKITG